MSGVGNILQSIAPVLSFIPGVGPAIGAAAGAVGALTGGNNANNQANSAYGGAQQAAQFPVAAAGRYYLPAGDALAQLTGYDPASGKFNPNFDPYFGQGSAMISRYGDAAAVQDRNASNAAAFDIGGRGFNGANSLLPSVEANIERGTASDIAGYTRNLGIQGAQDQYSRLASLFSSLNPVSSAGPLIGAGNAREGQAQGFGNSVQGLLSSGALQPIIDMIYGNKNRNSSAQGLVPAQS